MLRRTIAQPVLFGTSLCLTPLGLARKIAPCDFLTDRSKNPSGTDFHVNPEGVSIMDDTNKNPNPGEKCGLITQKRLQTAVAQWQVKRVFQIERV